MNDHHRTVALHAACVALVGLYVFTGYLAFNPNVSDSYAAYYIHRTTALTMREQAQVRPVNLGHTLAASTTLVAFDGWHSWDGTHRRSARRDPTIIFVMRNEVVETRATVMQLETSKRPSKLVTASLNGFETTVSVTDDGLTVVLPVEALRVGENALTLRVPTTDPLLITSLGIIAPS
jgi:hypothetical protein